MGAGCNFFVTAEGNVTVFSAAEDHKEHLNTVTACGVIAT